MNLKFVNCNHQSALFSPDRLEIIREKKTPTTRNLAENIANRLSLRLFGVLIDHSDSRSASNSLAPFRFRIVWRDAADTKHKKPVPELPRNRSCTLHIFSQNVDTVFSCVAVCG